MTKKQLEARIESLERELSELKNQVLSLALRPAFINPLPQWNGPVVNPFQPMQQPNWPGNMPIITCGDQSWQNRGGIQ